MSREILRVQKCTKEKKADRATEAQRQNVK